jgi:BON domain-containing protein/SPW repeat-containing protein
MAQYNRYEMRHERGAAWDGETNWLSGVSMLAGLWLIVSAFLFGGFGNSSGGAWNSLIVGIVIATLAAGRAYQPDIGAGLSWINAILGAWMIAAPFVYDYTFNQARTWNSIIVGFIIVIFAIASATTAGAAATTYGSAAGEGRWDFDDGERYGGQRYGQSYGPWLGTGYWPYGGVYPTGDRSREYASQEPARGAESYRGFGPRGYQRSDEQLRNSICERMTDDPRLDAREIDIHVQDGEVTLQGTVPDRWAKSVAESLAESVGGVRDVHNQLRVRIEGPSGIRRAA